MDAVSCAKIVVNVGVDRGVFSSARLANLHTDSVTVYKMACLQLRCQSSRDNVYGRGDVAVSAGIKGD
jgi:hypothetical protein